MKAVHIRTAMLASVAAATGLISGCASQPVASPKAGPPWAGETFLPDYTKLQAFPMKGGGETWAWVPPGISAQLAKYTNGIMIDQPELFISPHSPYTGAKPADLQSIAEFVRATYVDQYKAHGYQIVDAKGPGVLYIRIAVTDLQLNTKSRSILAYTPQGFVISSVYRALQDFMKKMDILYVAIQAEYLDGETGQALSAGVVPRGGNGSKMTFDQFKGVIEEYGNIDACFLDNARVPQAQQIDCTDPDARKARPKLANAL